MVDYSVPEWDMSKVEVKSVEKGFLSTKVTCELPDAKQIGGQSIPICVEVYKSRLKGPMLGAHPILGSKNNEFARFAIGFFTLLGWNGVLPNRVDLGLIFENLDSIEPGFQRTVTNNVQILQWLENGLHYIPELKDMQIKPQRMIYLGTSMGGITTAMTSGVMTSIAGFAPMMAGGDLANILAYSEEPGVRNRREEMMEEYGLTVEEFEQTLRERLVTDPKSLAPKAIPENVMLWISLFDKSVPTANQFILQKSYRKKPFTYYAPSNHIGFALFYIPALLSIWIRYSLRFIFSKK